MDATQRRLTETELDLIMKTLVKAQEDHGSLALRFRSPFNARLYIHTQSCHGNVVVFSEKGVLAGILLFSVGGLWWSDATFLFEELVLALNGFHGIQREAIKALDRLAKAHSCALIAVGSLMQETAPMILNGYKKAGYTCLTPIAIKCLKGSDPSCSPTSIKA